MGRDRKKELDDLEDKIIKTGMEERNSKDAKELFKKKKRKRSLLTRWLEKHREGDYEE